MLVAACASSDEKSAENDFGIVTMLGDDTLAVENVSISAEGAYAEVILRSPEVRKGVFELTLADDQLVAMNATWTREGDTLYVDSYQVEGDSLSWIRNSPNGIRNGSQLLAPGMLPFIDMVHWPFEFMVNRLENDTSDYHVFSGSRGFSFKAWRNGDSTLIIKHPSRGEMDVVTNATDNLISVDGSRTTRDLTVSRVQPIDIEALEAGFVKAEKKGKSFGALSGRGSGEFEVNGATVSLDYGTPSKRGRVIWGDLVQYGKRWRTGANRATHFTTDSDLAIGDLLVPEGEYTLSSIPGEETLTLIINTQTGQNGQSYDESLDLGRVQMQYRSIDEVIEVFTIDIVEKDKRHLLRLRWDEGEYVIPVITGKMN